MAIYIDAKDVPDLDNIPSAVFQYLIRKHKTHIEQLNKNMDYYLGKHKIMYEASEDKKKVRMYANYAKYVVDTGVGFYLGDPIKYNAEVKKSSDILGSRVEAAVKNGHISLYDSSDARSIDISKINDIYDNQTISEVDAKVGKYIGIFGECYELIYANSADNPEPRSAVIDPRNCIFVRDNTVEHNKLFTMVYEPMEDLSGNKYYSVVVYNSHNSKEYRSKNMDDLYFSQIEGSEKEHFFGEVPVVEYQNNDERQGDFEQCIPLMDGLNELLSDRVTDKKKFVNALLAMFNITLDDENLKTIGEEQFLDGLPDDARIEYIQKQFDESSMQILCNDIIREIHKMTLTVDMTDESFAGNSSGQALMLKLMTMNMLVKNKMRSLEKGLRKRFEIYNTWLVVKGEMTKIDKKELDIVFTVAMPIDKAAIVDMVTNLQDIVDDKTLLSQLWFIKDVDEVLAAVKKQRAEKQQKYMDSFGIDKNKGIETQDEEPVQEEDE